MTDLDIRAIAESCFPKKNLLLVDEVAVGFRKTKRTIYAWYQQDLLHGTNINGNILIYRVSAINLMVKNHGRKNNQEIEEKPPKKRPLSHAKRRSWVTDY